MPQPKVMLKAKIIALLEGAQCTDVRVAANDRNGQVYVYGTATGDGKTAYEQLNTILRTISLEATGE